MSSLHIGVATVTRARALLFEHRAQVAAMEQVYAESAEQQRLRIRDLERLVDAIRYEMFHDERSSGAVVLNCRRMLSDHGTFTPADDWMPTIHHYGPGDLLPMSDPALAEGCDCGETRPSLAYERHKHGRTA